MRSIALAVAVGMALNFLAQLAILGYWETHYRHSGIGGGWVLAWQIVSWPIHRGWGGRMTDVYWVMYANAALWGVGGGGVVALVRRGKDLLSKRGEAGLKG